MRTITIALVLLSGLATAQQGVYGYVGADCGPARIDAVGVPTIGTRFEVEVPGDASFADGPFSYLLTGFGALQQPIDIGVIGR